MGMGSNSSRQSLARPCLGLQRPRSHFPPRRETVPHALFFSPPLPPIEPQPGLKMDLCIHDVRAYLDFTRQRASQREVRRGSAVALGWCKVELIGVEQKAALMSTYGKRLSAWAAGIITTAVLVAPGYAQDKKVKFILDWAFRDNRRRSRFPPMTARSRSTNSTSLSTAASAPAIRWPRSRVARTTLVWRTSTRWFASTAPIPIISCLQ